MKLYVGNLPFEARDEELTALFAAHGTVARASVVVDHQRDRSRGFGFVEFEDPAHGKAAIAALHGTDFGGRAIVVNEARASHGGGRDDRRGGRGGFGGGRDDRDRDRRPGRRF